MTQPNPHQQTFIPASENRWVLFFFGLIVRWLFYRRFSHVEIIQQYKPSQEDRTIYILNHTTWWDGILPLLLNQTRFKQRARAMMELKQMKIFRVFRHIGAFSIDLESTKNTIRSLRYAVDSMKRERACLFIFPEGKINAPCDDLPQFELGTGWIIKQCVKEGLDVVVVPISVYIHEMTSSKPVLWVEIGDPVNFEKTQKDSQGSTGILTVDQITDTLHTELELQLQASKKRAYNEAFGNSK